MMTAEQAARINAKGFWFMDHKGGTCRHIDNTNQPPFIKRCRNLVMIGLKHCPNHVSNVIVMPVPRKEN